MDLGALTRLPSGSPLASVSPSSAVTLKECHLRAAYRSDRGSAAGATGSPAARLGSACHEVLEGAGRGELPDGAEAGFGPAFEHSWEAAIGRQAGAARATAAERHWPEPHRWRGYALRKVAAKHLARRLSRRAREAGVAVVEHDQSARGGRLRGRPDLVLETPRHEIEDYKTGSLYEEDSGEVKASYRTQMLLYGVLERERTGRWPERATLVPLQGEPAALDIVPAEAEAEAEEALDQLARYNAAVTSKPPAELGSPSPAHCRWCPYSVACPCFWGAADHSWDEAGIGAAAGEVTSVETAARGAVALTIAAEAGTTGAGALLISGLDAARFSAAASARSGSTAAVTGLLADRDAQSARPSARTRLLVTA